LNPGHRDHSQGPLGRLVEERGAQLDCRPDRRVAGKECRASAVRADVQGTPSRRSQTPSGWKRLSVKE
jgi:hypothetical protein